MTVYFQKYFGGMFLCGKWKEILKQMLQEASRGICGSIKGRKPSGSAVRRTKALVITRSRKKMEKKNLCKSTTTDMSSHLFY
jgi:hypothetical protein